MIKGKKKGRRNHLKKKFKDLEKKIDHLRKIKNEKGKIELTIYKIFKDKLIKITF